MIKGWRCAHDFVFCFKDKPRNLREVGEQLGANLVVEGSVLRRATGCASTPSWFRSRRRPVVGRTVRSGVKDVFAIQDEIARAIVNKLRLKLGRGSATLRHRSRKVSNCT